MQSINLHSHAQTFTLNESKTSHYAKTFTFKMLLREIDFQVHLGVSPPFHFICKISKFTPNLGSKILLLLLLGLGCKNNTFQRSLKTDSIRGLETSFKRQRRMNEFAGLFASLSARRTPAGGFSTKGNLPNCHTCDHQITLRSHVGD